MYIKVYIGVIMTEELNGMKTEDKAAQAPQLRSGRFLNRLGSGILLGVAGIVIGGAAASMGFVPAAINGVATSTIIGTSMFIAEWVRGIIE